MKIQATSYTFTKGAANVGTVTFTGSFIPASLDRILAIVNTTRNVLIYNPVTVGFGGTYTSPTLTLAFDTNAHANTDKLLIYCDDGLLQTVKAVDSDSSTQTYDKILVIGGKAEDVTALPSYSSNDAVQIKFDKETGAAIVLQADLDPRYDAVAISENSVIAEATITRPSNTTAYAANDIISNSGGTTIGFNSVSTGTSNGRDGGGYITGLLVSTNDTGLATKNLKLILYRAGFSTSATDNAAYSQDMDTMKWIVSEIDFALVGCIGSNNSKYITDKLMIPFKNDTALIEGILVTRDAFTPSANGTRVYIRLTITRNS